MKKNVLRDPFGRTIDYLRLSITDRCDFRCEYCMAEEMTFLPRKEVLTLEELSTLAEIFVDLGVQKIRVTGGEPLIRRDSLHLLQTLGAISQLKELCLSTNASHLEQYAHSLAKAGVKRINISLDTLNPIRFTRLTRTGDLSTVLRGIETAVDVGFKKIKINSVLMKNYNFDEAAALVHYALKRNLDISFIEEMHLGEIKSHARNIEFVSSHEIRQQLSREFSLSPSDKNTGGPSRYWHVKGYNSHIGFISPHSENFCASCNRVRVTASGRLLLCLGNEHSVDLRKVMRSYPSDKAQMQTQLKKTIVQALTIKPEKHEFDLADQPKILRFMNATGG